MYKVEASNKSDQPGSISLYFCLCRKTRNYQTPFGLNLGLLLLFSLIFLSNQLFAQTQTIQGQPLENPIDPSYARQSLDNSKLSISRSLPKERSQTAKLSNPRKLVFSPLTLSGGSRLVMISPERWTPIAQKLSNALAQTHNEFSLLFGEIPAFSSSIRLIDEEAFYLGTGAPKWTNAMYFRGQILIPLPAEGAIDFDDIFRSIKHEYTHAVIHALSNGKAPGWLDEGLAQWAEGKENPALKPALLKWLDSHPPVALALLQGGFTRLEPEMVPAAYAQSLFAARSIINSYGFVKIRQYFDLLRQGQAKDQAFNQIFRLEDSGFESQFVKSLQAWSSKYQVKTASLGTAR